MKLYAAFGDVTSGIQSWHEALKKLIFWFEISNKKYFAFIAYLVLVRESYGLL